MPKIPIGVKETVKKMYRDHSNSEIAEVTGLSVKQIKNYVVRHNFKYEESDPIRKGAEYLSKVRSISAIKSHINRNGKKQHRICNEQNGLVTFA